MKITILANDMLPVVILLIIIAAFAAIALVAWVIHKFLRPKLKDEDTVDEEKALQENLDRVLEPVDDKETAAAIASYNGEDEAASAETVCIIEEKSEEEKSE